MFNKKTKLVTLVLAIALILSQVSVFAADADTSILNISGVGVEKELNLKLEDLKNVPSAQIDEEYVYTSKAGDKTVKVKGISLSYLLSQAVLKSENATVTFEASDGYKIDPQTVADIKNDELKYVVAYSVDGQESSDLTIYRKQKSKGEFATVFKHITKISVGEAIAVEEPKKETTTEPEIKFVPFTDITEEYKFAEEAINALAAKGIVNGMEEGIYAPSKEYTREQFCKMVVVALKLEQKEYTSTFTDVDAAGWSAKYIQAAVESGLFKGNTDGTFAPTKAITRQEMASVAVRAAVAMGKVPEEKVAKFVMEKSNYEDKAEVQAWAENGVAYLEAQGVFKDIADKKFEPTKAVNRAEAAVVVYRALIAE